MDDIEALPERFETATASTVAVYRGFQLEVTLEKWSDGSSVGKRVTVFPKRVSVAYRPDLADHETETVTAGGVSFETVIGQVALRRDALDDISTVVRPTSSFVRSLLGLERETPASSLVVDALEQAQDAIDAYIEAQLSKRELAATEDEVEFGVRQVLAQQADSVRTDNPEGVAVAPEVAELTFDGDAAGEKLEVEVE